MVPVRQCDEHISIHALREEGDLIRAVLESDRKNFNPRPPRGGRQKRSPHTVGFYVISIHALREEGDTGEGFFL